MGKINDTSAEDDAEQILIQVERRNPFTQVGDWILLAPVSGKAKLLYWTLKAHANTTRGDNLVWPTQATLAEMLDFAPIKDDPAELRDGRKIRPFLKELESIDAIKVRKIRSPGGMRPRSLYKVYEEPPDDYDGVEDLKTFYAKRKQRIAAAQDLKDAARGIQEELDLDAASTASAHSTRAAKRRRAT
jgi:hypothetical protein